MRVAGQNEIGARAAREALNRLLSSKTFARSEQLRRFLEHTVETTLAGAAKDIKEYTIAVDVFGRPAASYDPRIDPIVRTEAQRLRKKLDRYYETEGATEAIRIQYPKGSYVPTFAFPPVAARRPSRVASIGAGLLGLVVLGASVSWLFRQEPEAVSEQPTTRAGGSGPTAPPRIVVLPFDDFSPDGEHGDFALAMTDSVITRLAGVPGLDVVSRQTMMQLQERSETLADAANLLAADYVVQGSVVRSGDACRVSARLIRTSDEHYVWSESFDFAWFEIFEAQDIVSAGLVEQLQASSAHARGPPTTSIEAYEWFLKGRYSAVQFNNQRLGRLFTEAERRLSRAIELDPQFADALAELGHVYYMRLYPPMRDRDETLAQSRHYLERALAIDPSNVTALSILGSVYSQTGRIDEGLELARKAVRIAPNNATTHAFLGERYVSMGFFESALVEFDAAIELDPLYLDAYVYKIQNSVRLGRWDEALTAGERARILYPENHILEFFIGEAYFRSDRLDDAERVWGELHARLPEADDTRYIEIALDLVATIRGDLERGRACFESYRHTPARYFEHLIELAAILGETDTVVARIDGHPHFMNYRWLVTNPHLSRLANEPVFAQLTRSLYDRWTEQREKFGDALPAPPPDLPDPANYLGRAAQPSNASLP